MTVGKVLDSKTKFKKKKQILNLRKKESFQFVPETANGKLPGSHRSSGSEFQNAGEAWKKRGPIVFVLVRGTVRRLSSDSLLAERS